MFAGLHHYVYGTICFLFSGPIHSFSAQCSLLHSLTRPWSPMFWMSEHRPWSKTYPPFDFYRETGTHFLSDLWCFHLLSSGRSSDKGVDHSLLPPIIISLTTPTIITSFTLQTLKPNPFSFYFLLRVQKMNLSDYLPPWLMTPSLSIRSSSNI